MFVALNTGNTLHPKIGLKELFGKKELI